MNFLEPWGLLGLTAFVPVIALYFLKLKREHRVVPSTLLWKKVIDDMQVNSPFQRLKYSLLLLLQLLLIAFLGFALARPFLSITGYEGQKTVLLMDTSASMATRDAGPYKDWTRLKAAIKDAQAKVDDLREGDEMMVVAFDCDVRQLTTKFTADRAELKNQLGSLETRDVTTRADDAFETAIALTEGQRNAKVVVLSDGCFGNMKLMKDKEQPVTGNIEGVVTPEEKLAKQLRNFSFVSYGETTSDNAGITQIEARTRPIRMLNKDKKFVDALETEIFVMVENFSPKSRDVVLSLSSATQAFPTDSKSITLKGRPVRVETAFSEPTPEGTTSEASRSVEVFKLPVGTTGVVTARITSPRDKFPVDDVAYVVVGSVEGVRLLLVSKGNYFLEKAFAAMRGVAVTQIPPEEFQKQWDLKGKQSVENYDVCVFDEYAPISWQDGGALFMGALPPLPGFLKNDKPIKAPDVVDWDAGHPIMRYVNFGDVEIAEAQAWQVPKTAKVLVEGTGTPLVTAFDSDRVRAVGVSFGLFSSNWVLRRSLPLFLRNAVPWIAEASTRRHPTAQQTGSPLVVPPTNPAVAGMLQRPNPEEAPEKIQLSAEHSTFIKGTEKTGLYYLKGLPGNTENVYAVNLASRAESDNAAHESLQAGNVTMAASRSAIEAKREIWRDLALAAGAILLLEWWVFHRRVGI